MKNKRVAFILLTTLFAVPLAAAIKQPVKVAQGLLSGVSGKDPIVTVFKGIPYAAPPVGDLRWRNPQPAKAWSGVRKADTFCASCAQSAPQRFGPYTSEFLIAPEPISEDCLALNIWTAAKSASERRAVYVFIHGGGFGGGSGSIPIYDGEGLAKKGIVVVTINYRVSMFGFLAHPELTKESSFKASGNYGLLDQIAALRWVQENIKAFGGDPTRVTIGGQSAGAMSVHDLIASPLARGLFHRGIIESGGSALGGAGISTTTPTLAEAAADGLKFAQSKEVHSLAEMRALTWQKLVETVQNSQTSAKSTGMPATPRFIPIIDGYCLPSAEDKAIAQGKQNDVAVLAGYNSGEIGGSIFGPQEPLTAESYAKDARQRYGDMADEFLKLYPATTDEEAKLAKAQSERDRSLASMYLWAKLRAKTSNTKAFLYLLDHTLPGPDAQRWGAFHTAEIPYVMNTLSQMPDRPFTETDRKIADMMSSYWANFIATGDPNGKNLSSWPAAGDTPEVMEVGDRNHPVSVTGSSAKFAFFEKFFSQKGGSVNQSAPKTAAASKAAEVSWVNCPAGTSQINLETFKAFLDELLVKKQPRQAFERLAMKDLIQYDSAFGESRETTIAQWESMTKQPDSKFEIESATLEGDIGVVSFSGILKPGTPGAHVINYFRFRCGKIVEIWDRFEIKSK